MCQRQITVKSEGKLQTRHFFVSVNRKSNLKSRLMSALIGTKVTLVGEGGAVVQRGGVGVLVNNLPSQSPLASPPLKEFGGYNISWSVFSPFSKTGRLLCSMRHRPP